MNIIFIIQKTFTRKQMLTESELLVLIKKNKKIIPDNLAKSDDCRGDRQSLKF